MPAQYRTGEAGNGKALLPYGDTVRDRGGMCGRTCLGGDYEDAVIERTAVKTEMDYIITRNVKDYQDGMAKAILPNDFIALMEKEE